MFSLLQETTALLPFLHDVPLLLWSPYARRSGAAEFGEKSCAQGNIGHMQGEKLMGLMLAHSLKLNKYGA